MRRIVILGSGTDVGKTFVAVALANALRRVWPTDNVIALKPIETGVEGKVGPDAGALGRATGLVVPSLYSFAPPVSPHLAAMRAGTEINLGRIRDWVGEVGAGGRRVIVETAGGAFSPLGEGRTNVDLAMALEPAVWVLVAPDSLGVLHDVAATVTAMRAVARGPDHLVVTAARERDSSSGTNGRELARLGYPPAAVLSRDDTSSLVRVVETNIAEW